jgi:hypothetical protein
MRFSLNYSSCESHDAVWQISVNYYLFQLLSTAAIVTISNKAFDKYSYVLLKVPGVFVWCNWTYIARKIEWNRQYRILWKYVWVFPCGRTERNDAVNSHFSQLRKTRGKLFPFFLFNNTLVTKQYEMCDRRTQVHDMTRYFIMSKLLNVNMSHCSWLNTCRSLSDSVIKMPWGSRLEYVARCEVRLG